MDTVRGKWALVTGASSGFGIEFATLLAEQKAKSGLPGWNVRVVSELLGYFATVAAATVTDTIPGLLGHPAISFEQFVKDHRAAFLALQPTSHSLRSWPAAELGR